MPNEITEYIAKQIEAGYSPDQIKDALKKSGWNEVDILVALKDLQGPSQNPEEKSKIMLYLGIVVVGIVVFLGSAVTVWYMTDTSRGAISVSVQQPEDPVEYQMVEESEPKMQQVATESAEFEYGSMDMSGHLDEKSTEATSSSQLEETLMASDEAAATKSADSI